MKVLFIGGTGTISEASTELGIQKGIEMFLLNRGKRGVKIPEGVKHLKCDKDNLKEMEELIKPYQFDCVVNWIAFTPEHVEQDIKMFSGKIGQYIFISSASVYQEVSN